jgi:serine/threonine-protein kinase HipA
MAGRHSRSKHLGIWMNGQRVGRWSVTATEESVLNHDADWIASEEGRPLSLSLPFQAGNPPHRGQVVVNYFDNLLPDSDHIRRRLAGHYSDH